MFWFTVKLPAVGASHSAIRARPELAGLRALIVDGDATNQTVLEHHLRAWSLATDSVGDPAAAIEKLEHATRCGQPYALALIDSQLPHGGGVDLQRAICERPALRGLRSVLMGPSPEQKRSAGIRAPAMVPMPVRAYQLYAVINDVLVSPLSHTPEVIRQPGPPEHAQGVVLIAEDNAINQFVAQALLGRMGWTSVIAADGIAAVDMALANDYAAILMDCQMPQLDGFEATQQIRAAETSRRVPIIAMTANSMAGDRERCIAWGMDDYISKPFRPEELELAMRRCLPEGDPHGDVRDTESDADGDVEPSAEDEGAPFAGTTIVQLCATLTLEAREHLLETFEATLSTSLAEIRTAALDCDDAELRRLAHKLGGGAAALGATRLKVQCQRLGRPRGESVHGVDERQLSALCAVASQTSEGLRRELLAD